MVKVTSSAGKPFFVVEFEFTAEKLDFIRLVPRARRLEVLLTSVSETIGVSCKADVGGEPS